MKEKFGRIILSLFGWKIVNKPPPHVKKAVLVGAPHTSNWDYVIGVFGAMCGNLKAKFLIKKEAFVFPFGPILKFFGGIPVDRENSGNLVDQLANLLKQEDEVQIVFTPEGTRKWVREWKSGFYNVARKAEVPIILCYLNYKTKKGGFGPLIYPSEDYQVDLKKIRKFYKDIIPKHPDKFNPDFE